MATGSRPMPTSQVSGGKHPAMIFSDLAVDGPTIGTLIVVLDRGKNLPNRKSIGKQDPYCVVRLGKEGKRTEADKRGGQTPKWDKELRFPVRDSPDYRRLKIAVFNDDKKTELIGECTIPIDAILIRGGGANDGWRELKCREKYAGEILVELTFFDQRPKEKTAADKAAAKKREMEKKEERKGFSGPRGGPAPKERLTYMEKKALANGRGAGRTPGEVARAERERAEKAEMAERERASGNRRERTEFVDDYEKPSRSKRDRRDRQSMYREEQDDVVPYESPTETRQRRPRRDNEGSYDHSPEKKSSRKRQSEVPRESRRSGAERSGASGAEDRERYRQPIPVPNTRNGPLDSHSPGMSGSYQDRYDQYDQNQYDSFGDEHIREEGYDERFDNTYYDDSKYRRHSPLPPIEDPMQTQAVRKRATFAGYEDSRMIDDNRQSSTRPPHQRHYSHSPQPNSGYGTGNSAYGGNSSYGGINQAAQPPPPPPPVHRKAAVDDRQFIAQVEAVHQQEFALVRQKSIRHYKSVPDWHPKNNNNNQVALRDSSSAEHAAPRPQPNGAPRPEDFSPLKNFQPKNPLAGALTFRGRDNFNNINAPMQLPQIPPQQAPLGFDRALPPPVQNEGPPPPPPPHASAPRTVQNQQSFMDMDKALVPAPSRPPSYLPTPLATTNNPSLPSPYNDSDEDTIPPNYQLVHRASFNPSPTPIVGQQPLPPSLVPGIDPQVAEELSERMAHERRMSFDPGQRAAVAAPPAPYVEDEYDDDMMFNYERDGPRNGVPPLNQRNSGQYPAHPPSPRPPPQHAPSPLQYAPPTPQPIRGRNQSPQPPPRRSPSPLPPQLNNVPIPQRRLSGQPFGPDAYDEINPGAVAPLFSGSMRKKPQDEMTRASYRDDRDRRERKQIGAPPAKEKEAEKEKAKDPTDVLPPSSFAPEPEVKGSPTKKEIEPAYDSMRGRQDMRPYGAGRTPSPNPPRPRAGRTPSPQPPRRAGRTPSPQPPRRGEMLALPEPPMDYQQSVRGNEMMLQNDRNRPRMSNTPAPSAQADPRRGYPQHQQDDYQPRSSRERLSIGPPPMNDYRSSRERLNIGPPPLDEYAPQSNSGNQRNDEYAWGQNSANQRSMPGQEQFVPRSIKERLSIGPPPLDEYAPRSTGRLKALPAPEDYEPRSNRDQRLSLTGPPNYQQQQDDYNRGSMNDRRSPVGPPAQDEYGYQRQMGGQTPNPNFARSARDRLGLGPAPGPGQQPEDYRRNMPPQDSYEDYDTRNGSARRSIAAPPPMEESYPSGAMVLSSNSRNYEERMQDQQQMQMEQQQQQQRMYEQQQYQQQSQQYQQPPQQPQYQQQQPQYQQRQPSPNPQPQYQQRQASPNPQPRSPAYQQPPVQQMQVQQPRHEPMQANYEHMQDHRHSMYNNNVIPEDRRLGGAQQYAREDSQGWDLNREVMSLTEELKQINIGPSSRDQRRKTGGW